MVPCLKKSYNFENQNLVNLQTLVHCSTNQLSGFRDVIKEAPAQKKKQSADNWWRHSTNTLLFASVAGLTENWYRTSFFANRSQISGG